MHKFYMLLGPLVNNGDGQGEFLEVRANCAKNKSKRGPPECSGRTRLLLSLLTLKNFKCFS